MGTITAQIIVGTPDLYHDGINPTHFLFLSENDRPAWILVGENITNSPKGPRQPKIVWIPTVEGILEDAFLMMGLHVMKDQELIRIAKPLFKNKKPSRVELYDDIDKADLILLRNVNKDALKKYNMKLIITSFQGSTIFKHLPVVIDYDVNIEVCISKNSKPIS